MQPLILLAACAPALEPPIEDTDYSAFPLLDEVGWTCADDTVAFRARTTGWHEAAQAVIWWSDGTELTVTPSSALGEVRQDQWCDLMVSAPQDLEGHTCADLANAIILVMVNYEEGCAGCALSTGADATDVKDRLDACDTLCDLDSCLSEELVLPVQANTEIDGCKPPPRLEEG